MFTASHFHRLVFTALRPLWGWRLLRLALRAAWLALALAALGQLLSASFHWPFTQWGLVRLAAFVSLFGALALWPIHLPGLVRRMDAALDARDQLATALEVAAREPRNPIEARLLQDAENILASARARFAQQRAAPWMDLEVCGVVALAALAVNLNVSALRPPLPSSVDYLPLPPLGAEPVVPLPGLPPELSGGRSPFVSSDSAQSDSLDVDPLTAQQALDALAQSLAETSATQSASQSLEQGDAAQAASDLRRLAEDARALSQAARDALAQQLRQAAEALRAASPDLAEQLQQAAEDLQSPDPAQAAEGFSALARIVEDLERAQRQAGEANASGADSSQSGSAGFGVTAGREVQAGAPTGRLSAEGQVVELPEGQIPSTELGALQGPSRPDTGEPASGEVSSFGQGGAGGVGGASGPDPLSYPWRWRDVVQGYFSTP